VDECLRPEELRLPTLQERRLSGNCPLSPKFIQRNRQIAHALASGMVDGVGDCGSDPHDADLAEILDAERID